MISYQLHLQHTAYCTRALAMSRTQRMPTQWQRQLPFGHNKLVKGISVLIAGAVLKSGVPQYDTWHCRLCFPLSKNVESLRKWLGILGRLLLSLSSDTCPCVRKPVILRASESGRLTCHGYCAVTGIKGTADLWELCNWINSGWIYILKQTRITGQMKQELKLFSLNQIAQTGWILALKTLPLLNVHVDNLLP